MNNYNLVKKAAIVVWQTIALQNIKRSLSMLIVVIEQNISNYKVYPDFIISILPLVSDHEADQILRLDPFLPAHLQND